MSTLIALDTETTSLNPAQGEIWDLAMIVRRPGYADEEHQWYLKPDLSRADPMALRIGRFYERTARLKAAGARTSEPKWADPAKVAPEVARLLDGAILLGAVPSFNTGFLAPFLAEHGQCLTAHYHLQDVENIVLGWLYGQKSAGEPVKIPEWPLKSDVLSKAVGVDPGDFDRHTALGDCRWVLAQWDAVTRS